jgi:N-acetylmuramoyl-L-alanine amidase
MEEKGTAPVRSRPRIVVLAKAIVLAFLAAPGGTACGGGSTSADAQAGMNAEPAIARGRELVQVSTLPPRAELLAVAQSIEAAAVREGAGQRALDLHMLAAQLLERMWRLEGKDQDGKEAIEILKTAARDGTSSVTSSGATCDAAVHAARLAGEVAHDAGLTYKELYRAQRRFLPRLEDGGANAPAFAGADAGAEGSCVRTIEERLAQLAPFRPPVRVLEAIDQGLAGEGALAILPANASAPVGGSPHLVRIDPLPGKEAARIVLLLDRPAHFRAGDEASVGGMTPRTFVELDGVDAIAVPRQMLVDGIVQRVSTEATTTGTRVALELDGRAYRRIFHLVEPYRIVIDIARNPPGTAHNRREVARVVLDPGHGGADPGAIGPGGTKEKDVTLDVARRARPALAKAGLTVVLTRDDDHSVALEERTALANSVGADLFMSIHCNAADNRTSHGVETYILDTTKDEIASRVAARENATSQAATNEIGSILSSMRMADQATHSTRLAELLQKASLASLRTQYEGVSDRGVHTAGFYVLVGARMPSALFETGYISNPTEETALASDEYRQRLADGIVNAVKAYREGR